MKLLPDSGKLRTAAIVGYFALALGAVWVITIPWHGSSLVSPKLPASVQLKAGTEEALASETYRGFEGRFSADEKVINRHEERLNSQDKRINVIENAPPFNTKLYGDKIEELSKQNKILTDKISELEGKAAKQQVAAAEPPKDGVRNISLGKQDVTPGGPKVPPVKTEQQASTTSAPPAPDDDVVKNTSSRPMQVAANNPCDYLPGTHWSKFGGPQGGCVPNLLR